MSSTRFEEQEKQNAFHRDYYQVLVMILVSAIILMIFLVGLVLYQVLHQPLPRFFAINPKGQHMTLTSYDEPNLMPQTIITWSNKAAVAAYTFDFSDYDNETLLARPYFTPAGWDAYQNGIARVIQRVTAEKLFANGVVSGPPVISNQGVLPGHGYSWHMQIPFLVTYQSADQTKSEPYIVSLTIVKVPTTVNPQGIGIEQFGMS